MRPNERTISGPGTANGPAPAEVAPPPRDRDAAVGLLLHHRIARQVEAVFVHDPLARADSPDGVHRMRVAVRRLRSALATGRPFLDVSVSEPLRTELAWLGGELGLARDAEVLRARLAEALAALAADPDGGGGSWDLPRWGPELDAPLAARHEAARAAVDAALIEREAQAGAAAAAEARKRWATLDGKL